MLTKFDKAFFDLN